MTYHFAAGRPGVQEVFDLFHAVGWTVEDGSTIKRSLTAYPLKVCARTEDGALVGYASVFSDHVMSTMLGELIVHPDHRKSGVGRGIMNFIEATFPEAPIYIKALGDSKKFYEKLGFKVPKAEMTVLFKNPSPGNV